MTSLNYGWFGSFLSIWRHRLLRFGDGFVCNPWQVIISLKSACVICVVNRVVWNNNKTSLHCHLALLRNLITLLVFYIRHFSSLVSYIKNSFIRMCHVMVTSSNTNISRIAGPLWGEFTGHRWIPLTKASGVELRCFIWSAPEQTAEQTIKAPVIWDAIALILTSLPCVMAEWTQWTHRLNDRVIIRYCSDCLM